MSAWAGSSAAGAMRTSFFVALAWSAAALALSLQGRLTSLSEGGAQPWWPSFGYSLAIASVWCLLTPAVFVAVRAIRTRRLAPLFLIGLGVAGLALVSFLHAAIFSVVYWPAYGQGQHSGPVAMARHMLVRNVGLDALFYAALLAAAWLRGPAGPSIVEPPAPRSAPTVAVLLSTRRGVVRRVPVASVLCLRAQGNHAEALTAEGAVLLDRSLAFLEQTLPATFARVHRNAIVRLDAVVEVRRLGRGDAELVLVGGTVVRLSRRYRSAAGSLLGEA